MREIEIWKDIKGFESMYQVSNLGRIKRLSKRETSGRGNYFREEHILSQRKNNKGYLLVDLYKNGKRNQILVHRLVASAFVNNLNNLPFVNHMDETRTNNKASNLEWCNQKYNMNYGSCKQRIGKANSKKIIAIDKNGCKTEFQSSMDASRKLGVSSGGIYDCLYGKRNRKTVGGYVWQFVK